MRVLVTGGAGFIGSHVVDALLAAVGVSRRCSPPPWSCTARAATVAPSMGLSGRRRGSRRSSPPAGSNRGVPVAASRWSRAPYRRTPRSGPRNGYAATKVAQEHLAGVWARLTGGSVVALRYHNVMDPGCRGTRRTPGGLDHPPCAGRGAGAHGV